MLRAKCMKARSIRAGSNPARSRGAAPEALACCCVSNEGGFKIGQKRVLSVGIGF